MNLHFKELVADEGFEPPVQFCQTPAHEPEKLPLLYPAIFVQKTGLEPANPSEWQSDMRPLTPLLHMKDE